MALIFMDILILKSCYVDLQKVSSVGTKFSLLDSIFLVNKKSPFSTF